MCSFNFETLKSNVRIQPPSTTPLASTALYVIECLTIHIFTAALNTWHVTAGVTTLLAIYLASKWAYLKYCSAVWCTLPTTGTVSCNYLFSFNNPVSFNHIIGDWVSDHPYLHCCSTLACYRWSDNTPGYIFGQQVGTPEVLQHCSMHLTDDWHLQCYLNYFSCLAIWEENVHSM